MKKILTQFFQWLSQSTQPNKFTKPKFVLGEKVYRSSPPGFQGFHTITSERIFVNETYFWGKCYGHYYVLDNSKEISAWEQQLEKAYNHPSNKVAQ